MTDEDQRTIYCSNLSEKVDEELIYELFLQVSGEWLSQKSKLNVGV